MKSDFYDLDILGDNDIFTIEPISNNFIKLLNVIGDISAINTSESEANIVIILKKAYEIATDIKNNIGNINDERLNLLDNNEKRTLVDCIAKLINKIEGISLNDTSIIVTTQNDKMLNVVIEELKSKDTEITNTINAYKTSVEEMNQLLGVEATSINTANERFRSLVEGGVSVD